VRKFSLKEVYPCFFPVAVACHDADYRLSWAINNKLSFKLNRIEDFVMQRSENMQFPLYSYTDDNSEINYKLVSNRTENGFLISSLRNIDYFMIVSGEIQNYNSEQLIKDLRKTPLVLTAFLLDDKFTKKFLPLAG